MFGKPKPKEFKFELGSEVKDIITGFKGVVVHRGQWLNNCNTYTVKPRALKDGMPQEAQHFDEPQLELIEEDCFKPSRETGGPERKVSQTNRL